MSIRTRLTHRHTLVACYIGYLTQALVINFPPLLFLTFQRDYGLSLSLVSALIAITFITQLSMDALASVFMRFMSYRAVAIAAHVFAATGMIAMATLPSLLPSPFVALCIATVIAGMGGGLTEVIISPMVEACPTQDKSGGMSLLHSFYCWGQMGTVLLSTLFFCAVGIRHWRLLSSLWAILPAIGAIAFCIVPVYRLEADRTERQPQAQDMDAAAKKKERRSRRLLFALFFAMMVCAGAAEMAMSQWASNFAEAALGVDKTLGDILGPCAFALMMALSRTYYGKRSEKMDLARFTLLSCCLCIASYLLAALSPLPLLSLFGCGLCGLSVGILWPGTYSRASVQLQGCGVSTFALLALGGDIGCLCGPALAGQIAQWCGGELRYAFLFALIFPVAGVIVSLALQRRAAVK